MVQPANKRLVTEAALTAKDYITAAEVQTIEGPEGPPGPPGADGAPGTNATITSATASGLAAGATPTVTLGGTASARTFAFGIPAGATGATGDTGGAGAAATVAVESTITGAAGTSASVTNQGTSSAANFRFTIPIGDTGAQGTAGTNGTNGTNGTSADITDVSASGLAAGAAPTATLGGTALARTIAFGIPAGATGSQGTAGTNATITGATAVPLASGASPTVTLGGTASARTFEFGIPAGAEGPPGADGSGGSNGLAMPRVLVSGRWVNTTITGTSMTTQAATASRMYLVPFVPHRDRSIDQLGCNVSTAATGNVRLGLYNADVDTGMPTTVLVDPGGTFSAGTTGGKSQAAVVTLTAGVQYYTAIVATVAATFTAGGANEMWPVAGGVSQSNVGSNHCYVTHSADSALPDLTGVAVTWAAGSVPMCTMRIA